MEGRGSASSQSPSQAHPLSSLHRQGQQWRGSLAMPSRHPGYVRRIVRLATVEPNYAGTELSKRRRANHFCTEKWCMQATAGLAMTDAGVGHTLMKTGN